MPNDSDDDYAHIASEESLYSSLHDCNIEDLQEVPSNRQTPLITEENSVTGDQSISFQDLNVIMQTLEGVSSLDDVPPRLIRDGRSYSLLGTHDNQAYYIPEGEDQSMMVIEDSQTTESSSEEEVSGWRGSHSGCEAHPGQVLERLSLQAREMADEVLASLPSSRSDCPPPGRLPVSISESSKIGIHLRIDLKNWKCKSSVDAEIPAKFRTDNDRNKGLPIMEVTEESVRWWLDKACRHFEYFATRLKALLTNGGCEENLNSEDYDAAFGLFTEEFISFNELVTYALKRLRPKVAEELRKRQTEVKNKFCKLEYASFSGRLCLKEDIMSCLSEDIQRVQRAIVEVYT